MQRIFLLSPARTTGERAKLLFGGRARFSLGRQLALGQPAPLGEVMTFLSGLYFRGKVAYTQAFARPPAGCPSGFVITPTRGLRRLDDSVTLGELREYATVDIQKADERFRAPLERHLVLMSEALPSECDIVLLGSVASDKYVEILIRIFGDKVRFPVDFVGRGDMSRGGLMLRCADEGRELAYAPIRGAARHGQRPAKLTPRRRPRPPNAAES